ncbi:DUF3168 domain-containing protein [Erythrobacter citreus]|uniref:DUF3168 domain-containing protein n=1 Tax=Qipengyuania citrea TaxID=225971 RepID=A0A6I4UBB6_9SPHN|nr:DUF3168 domain-containing protein [Qipengyuania citrea]MDQ0566681.1 hypothetical protein [Qipengyuania citrea]MXP35035.1 DUF3168 domain-containing protein [Qipengyuania citrea]
MEIPFRAALMAWLRADPILADMLNSIEEDGPVAASPPHLALVASAGTDWSTKTARGREIRLALELAGRGDDPAQTAVLAQRVEQRIATLAPQQAGYRIVVTQFLRSRVERRRRGLRAVLLEYRFTLIETE